MQKPIALLLSIILSLSVNSTLVFAASGPAGGMVGESAIVSEAVADQPQVHQISVADELTDAPVSPPTQDNDPKAVQGLQDGAALLSSPAGRDVSPLESSQENSLDSEPGSNLPTKVPMEITVDGGTASPTEAPINGEVLVSNDTTNVEMDPKLLMQNDPTFETIQLPTTAQTFADSQGIETTQASQSLQSFQSFQSSASSAPFELTKTVVPKADGGFMVRLEAYATSLITAGQYTYSPYGLRSNQLNYESGSNLWVEYEMGKYAQVTIVRVPATTPQTPVATTNPYFFENRDSLFERLPDGSYRAVQIVEISKNHYRYIYQDLTVETSGNGQVSLPRPLYISQHLFIYTYLVNGLPRELGRLIGPNAVFGTAFFKRDPVSPPPAGSFGDAYIKDSLSEYFAPLGADVSRIRVATAAYTGAGRFGPEAGYAGGAVSISADGKSFEIRGFDFVSNYVEEIQNPDGSPSGRGKKLIIEYPLTVRPGFLGGRSVPVTGAVSGVVQADAVLKGFPAAAADVPIPALTVQLSPINVYMTGSLTEEVMEQSARVLAGETRLDLSKAAVNYGLEAWQTRFIQIQKTLTQPGSLSSLIADETYHLEISLQSSGLSGAVKSADGVIRVFKPKFSFKDAEVWTGDAAPGQETLCNSLVGVQWSHGDIDSEAGGVVMHGQKPAPALDFEIPADVLENGRIAGKQDIPVTVRVTMGAWQVKLAQPAFMLKVRTGELTLEKTGGKEDETYVFNIRKDGDFYMTVALSGNGQMTIHELPTGTYEVEEEAAWAWRNSSGFSGLPRATVKLTGSETGSRATVTSVNSAIKNQQWLNDYSQASRTAGNSIPLALLNPAWAQTEKLEISG